MSEIEGVNSKMAARKSNKANSGEAIDIRPLEMREIVVKIVGTTPLIMNRKSEITLLTLLVGGKRKTGAERVQVKHDPIKEYRESMYVDPDPKGSTLLVFPAPGFKGAMCEAAKYVPGIAKTQVERLFRVEGYSTRIYGVPQLLISEVRSADMNRTPDVRTRAIIPEWCCALTLRYVKGFITDSGVANLIAAAGQICGVGDFRQEKGKGNFGLFSLVPEDDPEFKRIVKEGSRKHQEAAYRRPTFFDKKTAETFEMFLKEVAKRGRTDEVTHAG